jgi:hypothetical protein
MVKSMIKKIKFEEWFDATNPTHMDIATFYFKFNQWPINSQLDSINQSGRHLWPVILFAKLAYRYIELYNNPEVRKFMENFTKPIIT